MNGNDTSKSPEYIQVQKDPKSGIIDDEQFLIKTSIL